MPLADDTVVGRTRAGRIGIDGRAAVEDAARQRASGLHVELQARVARDRALGRRRDVAEDDEVGAELDRTLQVRGRERRIDGEESIVGVGDARREPIILDFATSRVAQGKMRVAHNEGRQVEPGTLIEHVAAQLSVHKRPREVRVVAELPRNAMGKVQHFELRACLA